MRSGIYFCYFITAWTLTTATKVRVSMYLVNRVMKSIELVVIEKCSYREILSSSRKLLFHIGMMKAHLTII